MKSFFDLREGIDSADKKPQTYSDPTTGKVKIRMVPAKKNIVTEEGIDEKILTPAEKKKREEIAKALERENPNMPMGKKMAIATATAKKVAEEAKQIDELSSRKLGQYSVKAARQGGDKRIAGQWMADQKVRKKEGKSSDAKVAAESVNIEEISQNTKDKYVRNSASSFNHHAAVARDAKSRGDETTFQKAQRIMKKRNQGMTRAFGGERS